MAYFTLVFLLLLGTVGAFGWGWHQRRQQKALQPSEEDQRIILALQEGTLADDDLEELGIDARKFRSRFNVQARSPNQ